jgi:hypothetical protein
MCSGPSFASPSASPPAHGASPTLKPAVEMTCDLWTLHFVLSCQACDMSLSCMLCTKDAPRLLD